MVGEVITPLMGRFICLQGNRFPSAIRDAETILSQKGFFGIFPEGGAWAEMIRPARPGAAYLAARTGATILPVGFTGFNEVLPIRFRDQSKVTIKVGKPYQPVPVTGKGRERRQQLDDLGDQIMKEIADLLPDHLRGKYSSDPEVRERAREVEAYPWETASWDEV